jgi:hypothetical protein
VGVLYHQDLGRAMCPVPYSPGSSLWLLWPPVCFFSLHTSIGSAQLTRPNPPAYGGKSTLRMHGDASQSRNHQICYVENEKVLTHNKHNSKRKSPQ